MIMANDATDNGAIPEGFVPVEYDSASPYVRRVYSMIYALNNVLTSGQFFGVGVPVEGDEEAIFLLYSAESTLGDDQSSFTRVLPIGIIATEEDASIFENLVPSKEVNHGTEGRASSA